MSDADSPLDDTSEAGEDMPTAPFWMTTYGDIMTLLVTFFVLLISMSEVRMKKFQDAMTNFQSQPGVLSGRNSVVQLQNSGSSSSASQSQARQRNERYEAFLEKLREKNLEDDIQANLVEDGIHVVIADSLMFRTARARLIEPSRSILRLLADLLSDDIKSVVVEGHTDDRPIDTEQFPSNWELSTGRAAASVRFLQENAPEYDPSRFMAVGYGPHHPRASNETVEGRARNRRVEILFSWSSWNSDQKPLQKRLPTP
jgi:chemotaxis protein MotB